MNPLGTMLDCPRSDLVSNPMTLYDRVSDALPLSHAFTFFASDVTTLVSYTSAGRGFPRSEAL